VLDLAPWTGRFFVDELDLLFTAVAASALWHGTSDDAAPLLSRAGALVLGLFALSVAIACARGLVPAPPLDANALASYYSGFNAVRVAKGFLWALVILVLLRRVAPQRDPSLERWLATGVSVGLAGVVLIAVREHWQFAGLFNFVAPYRVVASFSSMHTGGGHIEAYLAMAVPFLWLLLHSGRWPARALGAVLLAGATYVVVLTVARGGVIAFAAALAVLLLYEARRIALQDRRWTAALVPVLALAVAGTILYQGISGWYFQKRLDYVKHDAKVRLEHWRKAVALMDPDLPTRVLGMGLGSFPRTFLFGDPLADQPGTFQYLHSEGQTFVRLGAGTPVYLGQRVRVEPGQTYRLSLRARSDRQGGTLAVPLCERHLLSDYRCQWTGLSLEGEAGEWRTYEKAVPTGRMGSGNLLTRRPAELYLYNAMDKGLLDVTDIRLQDAGGGALVRNGDFSSGGDNWLFKTEDHLPWHIKNLWVALLFEQGWLGVLAFTLLVLALIPRLLAALWQGVLPAAVALASMTGFLTVGLVGSPFDAPRLTSFFFLALFFGLYASGGARPRRAVAPASRRPVPPPQAGPDHNPQPPRGLPGSARVIPLVRNRRDSAAAPDRP
jgi:hypothetical protein